MRGITRGTTWVTVREPGAAGALDSIRIAPYEPLFDRIIFASMPDPACSTPESCLRQIQSIRPDGSDLQVVATTIEYPQHPSVGPDGRRVVFISGWNLALADAADGSVRIINTGMAQNFDPSWSPDGRQIVLAGIVQFGGGALIYTINPDGSGRRLVSSSSELSGLAGASWSPDGAEVALTVPTGFTREAVVMTLATGARRSLTSAIPGFMNATTAWAPDGSAMLFSGYSIATLDFASGAYKVLADGSRTAQWSPDSRWIVYGAGDLRIMDRDGANGRVLLSNERDNYDASWTRPRPASGSQ